MPHSDGWMTPCPRACRLQVRGLVVCLQQLSLTFGTLLAGGINVALQVRTEASESAVGECRGQEPCLAPGLAPSPPRLRVQESFWVSRQ